MKASVVPFHDSILANMAQLNVVDALTRALVESVQNELTFGAHFVHCILPRVLSHIYLHDQFVTSYQRQHA